MNVSRDISCIHQPSVPFLFIVLPFYTNRLEVVTICDVLKSAFIFKLYCRKKFFFFFVCFFLLPQMYIF